MTVRRRAAAHVFVGDLADPVLEGADEHHLVRVLRVRAGQTVTVSDGRGAWRVCVMTGRGGLAAADDVIHTELAPSRSITVAFGLMKSDKPETVVQKLTELGVDGIAPVVTDHSVVRWDADKIVRQHDRFCRVVREAAMQSRHVYLPTVYPIAPSLTSVAHEPWFQRDPASVALAEPGGTSSWTDLTGVIIGPEGGFSAAELALVDRHVSLPGGVLRADTAAVVAGALLAQTRSMP